MPLSQNFLSSIPEPTVPSAAFRPYVLHGGFLFISGQLPMKEGKPAWVGRVPHEVSVDLAGEAAQLCCRHILSWVKHACKGDFGRVEQCIRLGGFVQAAESFVDAPRIINRASEMMREAFGRRGEHARVAMGVATLPFGAPVEIEALFAIRS